MEKMDAALGFELLKLLVQMAWSDLSMSPEEATFLLGLTERLCPGDDYQSEVLEWINGEKRLAAPDLERLKAHSDLVMKTMAQVSLADRKVVDDEREMLAQVATLLGH
ncbi:MAG: TerB family tellurite resistance protein [Deltaproteobacteria bacterium]|nr:TerB family tellurite resistance protein [Deltaproteobacteria bacterium]